VLDLQTEKHIFLDYGFEIECPDWQYSQRSARPDPNAGSSRASIRYDRFLRLGGTGLRPAIRPEELLALYVYASTFTRFGPRQFHRLAFVSPVPQRRLSNAGIFALQNPARPAWSDPRQAWKYRGPFHDESCDVVIHPCYQKKKQRCQVQKTIYGLGLLAALIGVAHQSSILAHHFDPDRIDPGVAF